MVSAIKKDNISTGHAGLMRAVVKSETIHLTKSDQKWSPTMHLTRDMSIPSINCNPSCLITSDWIILELDVNPRCKQGHRDGYSCCFPPNSLSSIIISPASPFTHITHTVISTFCYVWSSSA